MLTHFCRIFPLNRNKCFRAYFARSRMLCSPATPLAPTMYVRAPFSSSQRFAHPSAITSTVTARGRTSADAASVGWARTAASAVRTRVAATARATSPGNAPASQAGAECCATSLFRPLARPPTRHRAPRVPRVSTCPMEASSAPVQRARRRQTALPPPRNEGARCYGSATTRRRCCAACVPYYLLFRGGRDCKYSGVDV